LPSHQSTPLAEVAKMVLGPFGFVLLIIGTAISMFGLVSGDVLNTPRILFALSRDHVIPFKKISRIHPTYATPHIAIVIYCVLTFIIAATGSFEKLMIIATSSLLILYFGVAISVIRLRKKIPAEPREFKIPGGYTVPILSMGIILYFLSNLSKKEMIGTLVFIAFLTLLFIVMKAIKKRK